MSSLTLQRRSGLVRHAQALLLYAFLSLAATWPLAAHLTTHVTGDGIDDPALAWNLWWIKLRLVDQMNFDIFHSGWMFHPIDVNLAFYTLTPLNGLLSIPLQSGISLIVANNLILLSSFILGAYGMYLLANDLLLISSPAGKSTDRRVTHLAALSAGVVYAFASSKLFYASLGQFNIASSQWIPFAVLYILRTGRASTRVTGARNAALAGLFLVFQAWAELTYASFLLIFIALYFFWRIAVIGPPAGVKSRLADFGDQLLRFALMGVVFLIGIAPFLGAMLPDMAREGDFFGSGGGFADVFSADLMGYLTPTRLHPIVGDWVAGLPFPNDKGQHIFIGYVALALAVMGVISLLGKGRATGRTRREGWFWIAAVLLFWLLTLGPSLRWAGRDLAIPGPFALVSRLPFFSGNRYPSRYSVMLMLCVGALVAFGVAWLLARRWLAAKPRRSSVLVALLIALFFFEHLSTPLPLNDFRVPPIYAQLAAQPGDFTLLELPTGWRNGARVMGKSDVLIMMQQWWQTEHGKRRLGGNTSRNPAYKFQYFTEAPLIGDLIALMNADSQNPGTQHIAAEVEAQLDAMIERDRALAPAVLDFLGVDYVMVYVDFAPPSLLRFIDEALPLSLVDEWQGADWRGRPTTMRLYKITEKGSAAWSIDLSTAEGALHLAEGWAALPTGPGGVRYALRSQVDLLLDLPEEGGRLALELASLGGPAAVSLNGRPLTALDIDSTDGPVAASIEIPKGMADQLVDRLTLHFTGDPAPATSRFSPPDPAGWPVGTTGVRLDPDVNVVVRSAGEEVGGFAHIFVNGKDVAHNQRGYNLAALTTDGQVLDSAVFDTFASEEEATSMAAWLGQWPANTVIAGAVADEASLNLNQTAVDALRGIGVVGDLRGKFRWSHAFIGAFSPSPGGASPGSATEAMNLLQPANAAIGAPVDGTRVYGGVSELRFTPMR